MRAVSGRAARIEPGTRDILATERWAADGLPGLVAQFWQTWRLATRDTRHGRASCAIGFHAFLARGDFSQQRSCCAATATRAGASAAERPTTGGGNSQRTRQRRSAGLLLPQPTNEQVQRGLAALAAISAAMEDRRSMPNRPRSWAETRLSVRLCRSMKRASSPSVFSMTRRSRRASLLDRTGINRGLLAPGASRGSASPRRASAQNHNERCRRGTILPDGGTVHSSRRYWSVEWLKTAPDWSASRAYLKAHADELLTDEAEAMLAALGQAQQTDGVRRAIADHQRLLTRCPPRRT